MKKLGFLALLIACMLLLAVSVAAQDNVVFLASGEKGDGSSPDSPVGTLTDALNKLDLSRDATVVICGDFVQSTFFAYKTYFDGRVTITSVYDGVDYREQGAEFVSDGQRFICSGEYVFKDLTFRLSGNYYFIIANHFPVTVDTGVTMIAENPKMTGKSIITGFSILGGYQKDQAAVLKGSAPAASGTDPVNITVRSGSKIAICAYSRAIELTDFSGEATITVEGDAEVGQIYYEPINGISSGNSNVVINVRENAHVARISGGDKPAGMASFTLNWEGGTIDTFVRDTAATAGNTFTLTHSPSVANTIEFAVISPSFETVKQVGESASAFKATRTYENSFTDVPESAWYYTYVKTAYEYALANGTSATKFSPDGKFTVAQALTVAANIHAAYTGGKVAAAVAGEVWYAPYVNYCVQNGIVSALQFADYNKNITRGEMATVFANILPESEYAAVRGGANPDVTSDMACYGAVQKLYNAGIVGGDAGTGNYRPNDNLTRAEACVIFTRIAAKEYRAK